MKLVLDESQSSIRIRTFAEGVFARLAHDLELRCGALSASGILDRDAGKGSCIVEVRLGAIEVTGVLANGTVDPRALSTSDRRDILEKMRREVFHASADAIVRVAGSRDPSPEISVTFPSGRTVKVNPRARVEHDDTSVRVEGQCELSLRALGSDNVKGPMGAFRVKDRVEVLFDLRFRHE